MLRTFAILLLVACTNESPSTVEQMPANALSCEALGDHLNATCGFFVGEDFRALCEVQEYPLVPDETRSCASELTECTEATFRACDIESITIACDIDAECPEPLSCDLSLGECVRCLAHDDCAAGRGCLDGLCYDMDSEFYATFAPLFDEDAGVQD